MPNSDLLSEQNLSMKFYESQRSGNTHVFHIEDYYWVCKILVTPAEINDYLKFRERIYLKHKGIISKYPEQYILSHFLTTSDITFINEDFITSISHLEDDSDLWNISEIINKFPDKLVNHSTENGRNYYYVLKEVAKLNRAELAAFKERFTKIIDLSRSNEISWPFRFTIPRTGCGFVFIPFSREKLHLTENALINLTEIYKYKRKLSKCVGVITIKNGDSFDINWTYLEGEWKHNQEMEEWVKQDLENYGEGKTAELIRYRFKNGNTEKEVS